MYHTGSQFTITFYKMDQSSDKKDYASGEIFNKYFDKSNFIIVKCNHISSISKMYYDSGYLFINSFLSKRKIISLNKAKGCTRFHKMIYMNTSEYGDVIFKVDNITNAMAFCNIVNGFIEGRIVCKKNILDAFHLSKGGWNIPVKRPKFMELRRRRNWKQGQKIHPGSE